MKRTAATCFLAITFVSGQLGAAEGSKLSPPPQFGVAQTSSTAPRPTLKPARISIAQGDPTVGLVTNSSERRTSPATRTSFDPYGSTARPTRKKTSVPPSTRRTAVRQTEEETDARITFHPVQVAPLTENRLASADRRRTQTEPFPAIGFSPAKSAARPVSEPEVQYPVIAADEMQGDATAEYEEELAPIVAGDKISGEEEENFAPIISAADLPRPGRVRNTSGSEQETAPDMGPTPVQPLAATVPQEINAPKQPKGLFSGLRLPEFRSRPAR